MVFMIEGEREGCLFLTKSTKTGRILNLEPSVSLKCAGQFMQGITKLL